MDDWGNMNPDMQGNQSEGENPNQDVNNVENDVTPVSLSKKMVGVVIIIILVLFIIVLVALQSCSVEREVKYSPVSPTPEIGISNTSETSGNGGEVESEFNENTVDFGSSSGSSGENANSGETSGSDLEEDTDSTESSTVSEDSHSSEASVGGKEETTDMGTSSSDGESTEGNNMSGEGITEVAEPVLGEVYETTGMVSSKKIYNVNNNSYAYVVSLVLLTGENETTSVEYFCPRKTFDALNTADSVVVQYQVDSNGIVSIASVSR